MGLFNHHQGQRIIINGQTVSIDELVDRYNQLIQQVDTLQKQLASQPTAATVIVDGQQMTAADVHDVVDQWQTAAKQVKSATTQVAELKAKNAELAEAARAAQSITIGDKPITIAEMIDRYNNLLKEFEQSQNRVQQLQDQLADRLASITVDGQEVTAADVQALFDQRQDALEQAKSAADQVAELKNKNAELTKAAQTGQTLEVAGKPITMAELFDRYNAVLEEYQEARNKAHQLKIQLSEQATSLMVNGQKMTVADVQALIEQHETDVEQADATIDQLAELKAKNAELEKTVQSVQGLRIGDKPVTIDEFIKNYNDHLDRLRQADQQIKQLKAQATSLTVNNQRLTVADVQKLIEQREAADEQAKSAATQLATLKDKNTKLVKDAQTSQNQFKQLMERFDRKNMELQSAKQEVSAQRSAAAAAKNVVVNGEKMPVTELVKRYYRLLQQGQSRPWTTSQTVPQSQNTLLTPQPQSTQSTNNPAGPRSNANREKLIDRYYQVVQAVLGDYQDRVDELQQELTKYLKGNGQIEFLKLEEDKISPSSYQKMFMKRNKQMIRYVENHQHQVDLVRRKDQKANSHDELRGIRYWGNFVYRYRWTLFKLLEKNKNDRRNFKFAYHYAKPTALRIGESKPPYLSDQNAHDLWNIYNGIKDKETWKEEIDAFLGQANGAVKGAEGERLVRNVVKSYAYNRVLTSLNLPYQYQKGKDNSNQVDCIVVNQKGIFVLEIKNYTGDAIGIDQNGYIVVEKDGQTKRWGKIAQQGQLHYKAVLRNLEADEMTRSKLKYLKANLHVLYVSTNPQAEIKPVYPNANPKIRFIGLDGLRKFIDSAKGNLSPELIRSVAEVLDNCQQAEKRYDCFCFPSDLKKRADDGWKQFTIVDQLRKLKLDDFVDRYDPEIRRQLDMVGLVTRDGYVTSKPHYSKKSGK